MNDELISKKDLLELTGISYGQLYRWKRKDLIPEEWFVRKSTFTGQETFFPKEKILERINKIQAMKENLSLDELAEMFSPNITDINLYGDELVKRNIVSDMVLQFYLENDKRETSFDLSRITAVYILEKLLQSGDINLEEGKMIIQVLKDHEEVIRQKNCDFIMIRKLGVSSCLLLINMEDFHFEKGTKVIARLSLLQLMEEIKTRLG